MEQRGVAEVVERDARIEIVLPDGTALRVPETIRTTALRHVLAALRG
jgi:transposase